MLQACPSTVLQALKRVQRTPTQDIPQNRGIKNQAIPKENLVTRDAEEDKFCEKVTKPHNLVCGFLFIFNNFIKSENFFPKLYSIF